MVSLVITETEPNLYGYYRNRTVYAYKTVFTEVLKPYKPKNRINRTDLTVLTECAAIVGWLLAIAKEFSEIFLKDFGKEIEWKRQGLGGLNSPRFFELSNLGTDLKTKGHQKI